MRLFFFILLLSVVVACSNNTYYAERTLKSERVAFTKKIHSEIIGKSLNQPIDSVNWNGIFWASYMFNQSSDSIHLALKRAFSNYEKLTDNQKYLFWLATKTQAQVIAKDSLKYLALKLTLSKQKAAASQLFIKDTAFIHELFKSDESDYQKMISYQLYNSQTTTLSELSELLKQPIYEGRKHIICLMNTDRNIPGHAIIIDKNGNVFKKGNNIASYSYLARSATNFPFYLTNGNSPCGIYSIQGFGISDNVFIGPVPTLQTALPFEISPIDFFHGATIDNNWTDDLYQRLSGIKNIQFFESFWAGKLGRGEIIMHGSTINPEFYANQSFYPLTPSLGCITGNEKWDKKTGKLLESSHLELIKSYKKLSGDHGYLIVANISPDELNNIANNVINKF